MKEILTVPTEKGNAYCLMQLHSTDDTAYMYTRFFKLDDFIEHVAITTNTAKTDRERIRHLRDFANRLAVADHHGSTHPHAKIEDALKHSSYKDIDELLKNTFYNYY